MPSSGSLYLNTAPRTGTSLQRNYKADQVNFVFGFKMIIFLFDFFSSTVFVD